MKQHFAIKVLVGSIMTLILFVLIVLVINSRWFDQELDARFADVQTMNPTPLNPNNAYFGLMGFMAETNKDFDQAGMDFIQAYEGNLLNAGSDDFVDQVFSQLMGARINAEELKLLGFCQAYKEPHCAQNDLTTLSQSTNVTESVLSDEMTVLVDRYQQILTLADFAEPLTCTITMPIAEYGSFMKVGRFHLGYLLLNRSPQEFVAAINADILFWRKVLRQAQSLIGKMVAVAALSYDLQLIAAANLDSAHKQWLVNALTPLSHEELDISEAFIAENKMMIREVLNLKNIDEPIYQGENWPVLLSGNLLFQPNASANLSLEYFVEPLVYLSKLDSQAFKTEIDQFVQQQRNKEEKLTSGFFNMLYNPTGKLVVSVGLMRGEEYIARVHQLHEQLMQMR